jgi:hypothetical protein
MAKEMRRVTKLAGEIRRVPMRNSQTKSEEER